MQIKFPHKFSRQEAVMRVKYALDEARPTSTRDESTRGGPKPGDEATIDEERWDGDTLHFAFTAQGQHISGSLEVKDKEFELNATLPLMLRLFEGQIQKTIEQQAAQMLG